jgi:POT family proton-dependent oligopeptide transporter
VLFMGIAIPRLVPAGAMRTGRGFSVSPWWLSCPTGISELGELCLYPVGLSAVTKLSPPRIVGLMMGVWLLSIASATCSRASARVLQLDAAAAASSARSRLICS